MTHAYTDTQQIDEGWEAYRSVLGMIEDLFDRTHPYTLPCDFLTGGSYQWAEEIAIEGILSQRSHSEIVEAIWEGYDPTPDYMPIGEMF
jgi:hypothetical protein